MAVIIDGKALAARAKRQAAEAAKLSGRPGVVLADPASRACAAGRERDCAECGILTAAALHQA